MGGSAFGNLDRRFQIVLFAVGVASNVVTEKDPDALVSVDDMRYGIKNHDEPIPESCVRGCC